MGKGNIFNLEKFSEYCPCPTGSASGRVKISSILPGPMTLWKGVIPYLESLAYSPDKTEHVDLATSEHRKEFFIETTFGKLHGYHLMSANTKAVIIHFHGSGYNLTKHIGHVDWLPDFGYDVVMFDYLGYGKSEGAPGRFGIDSSSSQLLTSVLKQRQDIPVILFGQSLGGAIALSTLASSISTGRVRGIVVDSTFSGYSRMAYLKLRRRGPGFQLFSNQLSYLLGSGYDPVKTVRGLKVPLLILHSLSDTVVPFEEANLLRKEAPSDTDFWVVDGPGHTDVFRPGYQDYREKLDLWIRETLSYR